MDSLDKTTAVYFNGLDLRDKSVLLSGGIPCEEDPVTSPSPPPPNAHFHAGVALKLVHDRAAAGEPIITPASALVIIRASGVSSKTSGWVQVADAVTEFGNLYHVLVALSELPSEILSHPLPALLEA